MQLSLAAILFVLVMMAWPRLDEMALRGLRIIRFLAKWIAILAVFIMLWNMIPDYTVPAFVYSATVGSVILGAYDIWRHRRNYGGGCPQPGGCAK